MGQSVGRMAVLTNSNNDKKTFNMHGSCQMTVVNSGEDSLLCKCPDTSFRHVELSVSELFHIGVSSILTESVNIMALCQPYYGSLVIIIRIICKCSVSVPRCTDHVPK